MKHSILHHSSSHNTIHGTLRHCQLIKFVQEEEMLAAKKQKYVYKNIQQLILIIKHWILYYSSFHESIRSTLYIAITRLTKRQASARHKKKCTVNRTSRYSIH